MQQREESDFFKIKREVLIQTADLSLCQSFFSHFAFLLVQSLCENMARGKHWNLLEWWKDLAAITSIIHTPF